MLKVENLVKYYKKDKKNEVKAVDNVSFSAGSNEIIGLLGDNGAGKTTIIKCITTLIEYEGGSISINGINIHKKKQYLMNIGALYEGSRNIYWRLTPRENINFYANLSGISVQSIKKKREELLDRFNLAEKADVPVMSLSKGMQRKVGIITAFIKGASVLLLDEPTLGLDVKSRKELEKLIRSIHAEEKNKVFIVSSHDMNFIKSVCDRIIIVQNGRIITDDRIDNIYKIFNFNAYQIAYDKPIDDKLLYKLQNTYQRVKVKNEDDVSVLTYEGEDEIKLFDLLKFMKGNEFNLISLNKNIPNLEEIYLNIVRTKK